MNEKVTVREKSGSSLSQHEGVSVACDCCSCEAEPYWWEVAAEMGIDPQSDKPDRAASAARPGGD
ncbi:MULTISPECIES: hypothetical protein [unclassified Thioalkalivibrio]|uniref:hypothetical protein n=1 Tax=unclassified Thioalkalivibrio TaxID=2621013 RepID=UPI0009DB6406|nr:MULTISPECIES: hypothetical protein [unclassified Thioalkalivibrio]